jgi:hypothetical protein
MTPFIAPTDPVWASSTKSRVTAVGFADSAAVSFASSIWSFASRLLETPMLASV